MFGIGIYYLNGWAMAAADGANKQQAEWPPHPDRIFMSLTAAWFESEQDASERAALEWLEGLNAPGIVVSKANYRQGSKRKQPCISYVPVNDTLQMDQPEFRSHQARSFPVAIPYDPKVYLVWERELPEMYRTQLATLCSRVTHVGHSASLVQMWLDEAPPNANLIPVEGISRYRLRVFGQGRLNYLEKRCNRDRTIEYADLKASIESAKGKNKENLQDQIQKDFPGGRPVSQRPEPGLWQGYDIPHRPANTEIGGVFDPHLAVLSLSGHRLTVRDTLMVTDAMRGAVLAHCPEPIPEWVSGHTPNGQPSALSHLAYLPLPFVGREHADGHLMGLAVALPRYVPADDIVRCLSWLRDGHGLPLPIRLFSGKWFECSAEWDIHDEPPVNLRPETWTGPARNWASVTPIVFDRHFEGPDKWDRAADMVKDACERVGLPRPREALLHPVSLFEGVPISRDFPQLIRKNGGGRMYHSHVVVIFEEEVEGPVLIGAGRFRGYGFCRPVQEE